MKPSVRLLCRYLTIFVLLFQKYILLSERECFGRRYWLTCRPIARQSTQMLREASEEIFASARLVLTCLDKALHAQTISMCFSWNKYLLCVYGFFLLLVCDRGAHCQVNNSSMQYILLPRQARLMQSKIPRSSKNKKTSIGDIMQRKGKAQIKTIKIAKTSLCCL